MGKTRYVIKKVKASRKMIETTYIIRQRPFHVVCFWSLGQLFQSLTVGLINGPSPITLHHLVRKVAA